MKAVLCSQNYRRAGKVLRRCQFRWKLLQRSGTQHDDAEGHSQPPPDYRTAVTEEKPHHVVLGETQIDDPMLRDQAVTDYVSSATAMRGVYRQYQPKMSDFPLALMDTMHEFVKYRRTLESSVSPRALSDSKVYGDVYRLVASIARSRSQGKPCEGGHPTRSAIELVAAVYDELAVEIDMGQGPFGCLNDAVTEAHTRRDRAVAACLEISDVSDEASSIMTSRADKKAAIARVRAFLDDNAVSLQMEEICRWRELFRPGFKSALVDTLEHFAFREGYCFLPDARLKHRKAYRRDCEQMALVAEWRAWDEHPPFGLGKPGRVAFLVVAGMYRSGAE